MGMRKYLASIFVALVLVAVVASSAGLAPHASAATGDWTSYLFDNSRDGYNASETIINQTSAPHLKVHWRVHAGGKIASEPIVANGLVYWGSWDGYEHATNLSGVEKWRQFVGTTAVTGCRIQTGPVSTGTVTPVSINGVLTPVLYVGGGNSIFYALNANTGVVLWQQPLGSSPNYFIWSSPAIYNGNVYIGVSSFSDCPLVQGQLVEMNEVGLTIAHTFNVVPTGCVGGSVWGSPSIDVATGDVYFGTGNPGQCATKERYTEALVDLKASDLSVVAAWQVPQVPRDLDFGSTPTLFTATINGVIRQMVGLVNKNGTYYAFDRRNVGAGPVWQARITNGGGAGALAPSAWDGTHLVAAGGKVTLNGVPCAGNIRSLNPATGATIWARCIATGEVVGAVVMVPGLAVVGAGNTLLIYATSGASAGKLLFSNADTTGSAIDSAASISNGVLYVGNLNHNLTAIGT